MSTEVLAVAPAVAESERLAALGLSEHIAPYLSHFALCYVHFAKRHFELNESGRLHAVDELEGGLLVQPFEEDFEQNTQAGEREVLVGMLQGVDQALLEANTSDAPDWSALALGLIDKATLSEGQASENEQALTLMAALTCVLLSDSRQARYDFIRKTHQTGTNQLLASALDGPANLSFIIRPTSDQRFIRRYRNWAEAFEANLEDIEFYVNYVESIENNQARPTKPKARQREVYEAYKTGQMTSQLAEVAASESVAQDGEQSYVIDPFKMERFALQQMFISDQLAAVFTSADLMNSPFAQELAKRRKSALINSFRDLRDQAQEVLGELTQPVVELYHVDPDQSPRPLTKRQVAAQRFAEVIERRQKLNKIAHFLDYDKHFIAPRDNTGIWVTPNRGAAAPAQTELHLLNLKSQAINFQKRDGKEVSASQLLDLALAHRKYLTRLAMVNIEDFRELDREGYFSNHQTMQDESHASRMTINDTGQLTTTLPLESTQLKHRTESYSGATFGCPAGRVGLDLTPEESKPRGITATNSFIDYIIEVMIREAHARGLLEV